MTNAIQLSPTIDEVAIVMFSDQFLPRDIILHKRNAQLVRIFETHRCYDALQYPIIFSTNKQMDKKCSGMN